MPRHPPRYATAMQVLLDRPLGVLDRLKTIYAGLVLRDLSGWWRVLLFGRTGPVPKSFDEKVADLEALLAELECGVGRAVLHTLEETTTMLAALSSPEPWTPKPVEFEWFVSEMTLGKGIWVDAFIDGLLRDFEHDGWRVESWLYPAQSHYRRLVVHACRPITKQQETMP